MYKLPQLPHDQLQAFVCELFNQMMVISETRDFEITGKLIQSSFYNTSIITIPLPIEEPTKDAIENLKKNAEEELKKESKRLLNSKNLTKRTLVIATNYALELKFQDYLDSLNLGYPAIYLDWQAISLLADNPASEFNLSQYYPNLDFQQLPYNFNSAKEEMTYYRQGVFIANKIFGNTSLQSAVYRIRLAGTYEKQSLFLEALKEHKENAKILDSISKDLWNHAIINLIENTYKKIGNSYYNLGDYVMGITWYEDLLIIIEDVYKNKQDDDNFLSIITGLLRGYNLAGFWGKALEKFESIEYILTNSNIKLIDNNNNYILTPDGNYVLSSNSYNVSIVRLCTLYTLGIRIYEHNMLSEKAFVCFNELWQLLKEEEDAKLIDTETGINKEVLRQSFPNYVKKIESEDYLITHSYSNYFTKLDNKLPFAIKQIEIRNYHCISNISIKFIPVDTQWIFITGKNGTGKSSILQALVVGLIGGNLPYELKKDTVVEVELLQNFENKIHRIGTENLPVLAYGASRLRIQSEQVMEKNFEQDNTYSLFYPASGNLMNIEPWIKDAKLAGEEAKIEMVQDVLCQLMPSVTKITLKGSHISYIENGIETSLEKLASGNRSILAMVGDMIIRLFYFFPDAKKPSDLQGIVLIDELDLHLHPYWQRELPWRLSEIFPNVQFICTTHSIVPFMGAPKRSVFFTMDRTEEEGSTIKRLDLDVSNFSADILLTSPLFGVSLFSKVSDDENSIQGYRTEGSYEDYKKNIENNQKLKELQEKYGDIFGDLFKK